MSFYLCLYQSCAPKTGRKLAVVHELLPGRDGKVRAAVVKVRAPDEAKG